MELDQMLTAAANYGFPMLLSVVNLKLRDFYKNLDALCEDLDADKADLCAKLKAVGYEYDAQRNQFV